jgi:hypothetical protein
MTMDRKWQLLSPREYDCELVKMDEEWFFISRTATAALPTTYDWSELFGKRPSADGRFPAGSWATRKRVRIAS